MASFSKSFSRLQGPKGTKTSTAAWGLGWASHPNRQRQPGNHPDLVPDLDPAEAENSTANDTVSDPESTPRNDSNTKKKA